jgi:hypothetical protein
VGERQNQEFRSSRSSGVAEFGWLIFYFGNRELRNSFPLAFHGKRVTNFLLTKADVAELADALDSKSSSRK